MLDKDLVHDGTGMLQLLVEDLWRRDVVRPLMLVYVHRILLDEQLTGVSNRGGPMAHGILPRLCDRHGRSRCSLIEVCRRFRGLGERFDGRGRMTRWGGSPCCSARVAHGALGGAGLPQSGVSIKSGRVPRTSPRGGFGESREDEAEKPEFS